MSESMMHYIHDAFIHTDVQNKDQGGVNFTLRIDRVSMSAEQFDKLMGILERAASEAKAVIGA